MADGCHVVNEYKLRICISERDIDILNHIKKSLQYSGPIKYWTPSKSGFKPSQNMRLLVIGSKQISADLLKYQITNNKTHTLPWLHNDDIDITRSLVRGYFDGDGCIHLGKSNRQMQIIFQSSEYFCSGLQQFLKNSLSINSSVKNIRNIHTLKFGGNKQVKKFMSFLYDDNEFKSFRKWNKYQEYLEILNNAQRT